MTEAVADPKTFYNERVPAQFNRALDAVAKAAEAADPGPEADEAARILAAMQEVDATLRVIVEGDSGGTFFLNIAAGQVAAGDTAAHQPFLTLVHDVEALAALQRESGDDVLGFLGALAGLDGGIRLTGRRIQNLGGLTGALRFELAGEDGFTLITHFGDDPIPDEPTCLIRVDAEAYHQLRAGELNPQDAFMSGKVEVEGDMQMAMQLALAAMSPD